MKKLILAMTVIMSSGMQLMRGASTQADGASEEPAVPAIFAFLEGKTPNLTALFSKKESSESDQTHLGLKSISQDEVQDNTTYLLVWCKNTVTKKNIVAISTQCAEEKMCFRLLPLMFECFTECDGEFRVCKMKDCRLGEGDELFWGKICFIVEKRDATENDDLIMCLINENSAYQDYLYPVDLACNCTMPRIAFAVFTQEVDQSGCLIQ